MGKLQIYAAAALLASIGAADATPTLTFYVDQTATYRYCGANASSQSCTVPSNWYAYDFDDSGWATGNGPFSSGATSGTIFNNGNQNAPWAPDSAPPVPTTFTQWNVNADPYLRTYFTLDAPTALTVWIAVDNGINSLYLNGVLSTGFINAEGAAFRWETVFDIPAEYTYAGMNVIALQLEDHGGATGFDMVVTSNDAVGNPIFTTNPPPPALAVPAPESIALLGFGLAGVAWGRRKIDRTRAAL
jgi:hypothetical protein